MYVYNFTYTNEYGFMECSNDYETPDLAADAARELLDSGFAKDDVIRVFRDTGDSLDGTVVRTVRR